MNIKNYTSSVPVERSVMLIEHQLSRAGAQTISKWYDENKDLAGISFQIVTNQEIFFGNGDPNGPSGIMKHNADQ